MRPAIDSGKYTEDRRTLSSDEAHVDCDDWMSSNLVHSKIAVWKQN